MPFSDDSVTSDAAVPSPHLSFEQPESVSERQKCIHAHGQRLTQKPPSHRVTKAPECPKNIALSIILSCAR